MRKAHLFPRGLETEVREHPSGGVFDLRDWAEELGLTPRVRHVLAGLDDTIVNGQFVYAPLFVPFDEYVDLPSGADPGDYKFQVVLHDKIANADFNLEQPFTINKP